MQICLVREVRHPEIVGTPIYEDELVLVVDRAHRLARRVLIGVEELAGEQLVLFDRTSSYHELTSAAFRAAGVEPSGVMELDNIDAAKKMVEQGLGVALLPQTAIAIEVAAGTLVPLVIRGVGPVRRQIVAVRRRDAGPPAGAAAAFMDMLAELQPGQVERLATAPTLPVEPYELGGSKRTDPTRTTVAPSSAGTR